MMLYLPIPKVSVWGSLGHLSFGEKFQGRRVHKEGTKRSYPEKQPCSNVSPSFVKLLPIASYSIGTDLGTKDTPQEGQLGKLHALCLLLREQKWPLFHLAAF